MGFITDLEMEIENDKEDDNICSCGGLLEHDHDKSVISDLCSHDNEIIMTCNDCGESFHS